ncbi:MAG: efflux RND transporter permease subunit [Dehalococcoidia bacterium]
MGLTRLSIQRPLSILMIILGIVLMGAISYTHLRVDRLPPIDIPFLGLNVQYPQASAQDVELLVTQPLENAVAGLSGVTSVSSTSSEGRSSVTIRFANGTNVDAAALEVGRRVAAVRRQLPADATEPTIFKADPNASPILNIALTGAPVELLFDLANTALQPALQSVPGVASVTISGGLEREIQVQVDYAKLAGYGVTIQQISSALTAANVTAPVGSLDQGTKTLNMRAVGAVQEFSGLEQLVILQPATGGPVLLRDVAKVTEGTKEQTAFQRMNGAEAVGLTVVKQSDANELQVAGDVKLELERLRGLLPEGTELKITNDNSIFTQSSLDAIQRDLLLAIVLVGVVMLLFLHQWRNTVIVLLAIPTVLISTFLFMFALGFTLNIMTLMALALMIGILVDDSIVVLENIHRHLEMGESPIRAALNGRSEIGLAAIAITLADVIVYAPIAFVSGTVGQLFRQYGLTIVIATLLSLIVSFTLTPMVASRWMKHESGEGTGPWACFGRAWDRAFGRLGDLTAWSVPYFVRSRWLVTAGAIGSLVFCGVLLKMGALGTEYAPQEDDGNLRVSLNMPAGTSLSAVDDATRQLEDRLQAIPEVKNLFTTVRGGGSNIAVEIGAKHDRHRSATEIADEIRAVGRTVPGAQVNASINSPLGGGGGTNSVQVQVSGPELDTLTQIATQVQAIGTNVQGLSPLQSSGLQASPELHIRLDRARMAQLGVTSQSVASILRTSLTGSTVSTLRRPGEPQVDITIVGAPQNRASLNDLMAVPVAAAGNNGQPVTLGQIARIEPGSGPVQIQRTDRNRTLTLRAAASGRPLGPVAADLRAEIAQLELPPGYAVTLGGQVAQLDQALSALSQALILAVVLEYMLLVALYQSWFYPLVRMMAVPLGLVGALVALIVTGNTLNIFSIIGLVMAEGLVAKTSILLIDYTNTLREEGMERTAALAEAARTRLRPILMTSATMVFGMFPLALKLEAGAESRAPIAVVVIGALISSTFLTLIVVPALYTLFDDLSEWVASLGGAKGGGGGHHLERTAPLITDEPADEPAPARGGMLPEPMSSAGPAGGA